MTQPFPDRPATPADFVPEAESRAEAAAGEAFREGPGPEASSHGPEEGPRGGTGVTPSARGVQYKGAPLEAKRGPGLGCFQIQIVVLAFAIVITPLSVAWGWPDAVSAALLFLVLLLLLLTGQTVIFLLRLVAADRRATGRRRPLASATKTVGELEDIHAGDARPEGETEWDPGASTGPAGSDDEAPDGRGPVRQ